MFYLFWVVFLARKLLQISAAYSVRSTPFDVILQARHFLTGNSTSDPSEVLDSDPP